MRRALPSFLAHFLGAKRPFILLSARFFAPAFFFLHCFGLDRRPAKELNCTIVGMYQFNMNIMNVNSISLFGRLFFNVQAGRPKKLSLLGHLFPNVTYVLFCAKKRVGRACISISICPRMGTG